MAVVPVDGQLKKTLELPILVPPGATLSVTGVSGFGQNLNGYIICSSDL